MQRAFMCLVILCTKIFSNFVVLTVENLLTSLLKTYLAYNFSTRTVSVGQTTRLIFTSTLLIKLMMKKKQGIHFTAHAAFY